MTTHDTPEQVVARFGERLREIRKGEQMSQSELAARSGVKQAAISEYETGGCRRGSRSRPFRGPDLLTLVRLAQALRVSVAEFVTTPQI